MISTEYDCFVSPEVEDYIATKPYHLDGIRELAAMLPEADAELEQALLEAARRSRADHFEYGLLAAAFANRKLSPAVLRPALTLGICAWTTARLAWRLEGDVLGELRWAFDTLEIPRLSRPILLFTAAAIARRSADVTSMPEWILHRAKEVLEAETRGIQAGNPTFAEMDLVSAIALLYQDKNEWPKTPKAYRTLRGGLGWLEAPFQQLLFEKRTRDWDSVVPQRRASRKIGANEKCPCGSGKKYKKCCRGAEGQRFGAASPVAGMTEDEFEADPTAVLTESTLRQLKPHQLLRVRAVGLLGNLHAKFFAMLMRHRQFDAAIKSLQECAVTEGDKKTLPAYLQPVWLDMLNVAVETWQPQFARDLLATFPDAEQKCGPTQIVRARLLAAGDEIEKFFQLVEAELRLALNRDASQRVQEILEMFLHSPWPALGIFLTRSLLPIAPEEIASALSRKSSPPAPGSTSRPKSNSATSWTNAPSAPPPTTIPPSSRKRPANSPPRKRKSAAPKKRKPASSAK